MQIYIVLGCIDYGESTPLSAHVDNVRAEVAAAKVKHYDSVEVVVLELDLTGTDLETGALSRMVLDAERRLADH